MKESEARELIVEMARSMFERRLTFGSSGNISVKIDGGWLMTPTGSSLGRLDPARLSKIDEAGHIDIRGCADQGKFPASRHVPGAGRRRGGGAFAFHPFRCRVVP